MLRFLDAGESHGRALTAIIEGIPSNIHIDIDFINKELKRRQTGYGRGKRMTIEKDKVEIWSGVRANKTTGNPITLIIYNKDYNNWKELINKEAEDKDKIFVPRPGHGDLVGYIKYNTGDIRNIIERTSARETAIRTAVGAICKYILKLLGIDIRSKIQSIGEIFDENVDIYNDHVYKEIEDSPLRCYNKKVEKNMINEIDNCKKEGDTIGGSIYISIKGMPVGIGSYTQWDRKLDALLSYSIMSVQGIKAVEFGEGLDLSKRGSTFNDEIYYDEDNIKRKSNNAGGIEAGVSNGEDIIVKAYMKPIPSIKKPIKTINLKEKTNVENRYERSDVCGVVPASIVLENVCAFEILKEILNTYPCDDFNMLKKYMREM
ncbi:chorismate synthase [Clostridium botulinum]|nr:chorismate synthase [Clostridium botulinum]